MGKSKKDNPRKMAKRHAHELKLLKDKKNKECKNCSDQDERKKIALTYNNKIDELKKLQKEELKALELKLNPPPSPPVTEISSSSSSSILQNTTDNINNNNDKNKQETLTAGKFDFYFTLFYKNKLIYLYTYILLHYIS